MSNTNESKPQNSELHFWMYNIVLTHPLLLLDTSLTTYGSHDEKRRRRGADVDGVTEGCSKIALKPRIIYNGMLKRGIQKLH